MPREHADGVPDRAVGRIRHHRVGARAAGDALVLGGIDRLVRLDVFVALAVAVGVEHERRPALRLGGVAGLVEHLGVEPAGDRAGAAESTACRRRRSRTAGDACRSRCRRRCTSSSSDRASPTWRPIFSSGNALADGWSEPFLQKAGIVEAAHRRGEPDPALARRTWSCGCWPGCPRSSRRPNRPTARIGLTRRGMAGAERFRHLRIAHRHLEDRHRVASWDRGSACRRSRIRASRRAGRWR